MINEFKNENNWNEFYEKNKLTITLKNISHKFKIKFIERKLSPFTNKKEYFK